MAGVSDRALTKTGPWPLGVDNTSQEGGLTADEMTGRPIALREAVNVDLSAVGRPRRRKGRTPVFAGSLVHSLWSHELLDFGLLVDGGALTALRPDQSRVGLGVAMGNLPVSYALVNDRVYCANRAASCVVDLGMQAWSWSPEQPAGQPTLAAVAGSLPAGQYQVAVTFTDMLGRESGATLAAVIDLPNGGGIAASDVPAPAAGFVNLYLSAANDAALRLYASAPLAPGAAVTLTSPATGRALTTQFLEPMPAGDIVRFGHGRLWVARGNELFWSEALRFGLYHPARNRMRFNAPVDLLEPIGDGTGGAGVFVAAGNHTYWYGDADPAKWTQATAALAGAVPGSSVVVPGSTVGKPTDDPTLVWLSRGGSFVVGSAGGTVAPIKNAAAIDDADRAATLLREQDGITTVVSALRAPTKHGLAVTDTAYAHVVHRDAPWPS